MPAPMIGAVNQHSAAGRRLPPVSCVVVAFHRPASLATLLGALTDPRIELLVVNVGDDVAVTGVASRAGAMVVSVPGNPGYAAAVNRGVAVCSHDVVVFLNDDLLVSAEGLLALAGLVSDGVADVAVPRLVTSTGDTEPTIAALPTPASLAVEWMALPDRRVAFVGRLLHVEKWRRPAECERISSAAAAMVACGRALLMELPLPEVYFLYWEESEWFWRLAGRDATVVMDPRVVAQHQGGRGDVRAAKSRLLATNAVRCIRRTQGRSAALLAWPVVVLWNARLVAIDGARACADPSRRAVLRARLAGLRAAIGAIREVS